MSNTKLTYEYTLNSIKKIDESIDKLNAKLSAVLTISGILINFGKDLLGYSTSIKCGILQYPCFTCYFLQLGAYILIIISVAISLRGLLPNSTGRIVLPEQLLSEEWNKVEEDLYMTALINYLEKETLLKINELAIKKQDMLNFCIKTIAGAFLLLGLDKVLSISLPLLEVFCLHN